MQNIAQSLVRCSALSVLEWVQLHTPTYYTVKGNILLLKLFDLFYILCLLLFVPSQFVWWLLDCGNPGDADTVSAKVQRQQQDHVSDNKITPQTVTE